LATLRLQSIAFANATTAQLLPLLLLSQLPFGD
jgi:hypothetical protein